MPFLRASECQLPSRLEKQFGYEAGELLGQSADLLFPRPPSGHPGDQSPFTSALKPESTQKRLDTIAVRKDGLQFPLSICLTSLMTTNGMCVVAWVDGPQGSA